MQPLKCGLWSKVEESSNLEPIKSLTRFQRLATDTTFEVWSLEQSRGNGHRSLVTPKRVFDEASITKI